MSHKLSLKMQIFNRNKQEKEEKYILMCQLKYFCAQLYQ